MKLIIKSFLVLVFITFISCKNEMEKSIIEPLDIKTIKSIIEKDSLFEFTYNAVQKMKEDVIINDIEKAKWSDITYDRVHKLIKLYSDSSTQNKYTKEIKKKWTIKYGMYNEKADSIADYWKRYLKDNSLNKYIKIELFDVKTSNREVVNVGFKISQVKDKIEDLNFKFIFIDKKELNLVSSRGKFPNSEGFPTRVFIKGKITKPEIHWSYFMGKEDLKNKSLKEILNEYFFILQISSLKKNGKRVSVYDIKMPSSVENYIDAKDNKDDTLIKDYKDNIIKDFLNNNYVSYDKYVFPYIDSIAKALDPDLLRLIGLTGRTN
mgnify:CR=1 FL=1